MTTEDPIEVTLWLDMSDAGLRAQPGFWECPRDAHDINRALFPRVTREQDREIQKVVGVMMPQSAGEVSHVKIPEKLLKPKGC